MKKVAEFFDGSDNIVLYEREPQNDGECNAPAFILHHCAPDSMVHCASSDDENEAYKMFNERVLQWLECFDERENGD